MIGGLFGAILGLIGAIPVTLSLMTIFGYAAQLFGNQDYGLIWYGTHIVFFWTAPVTTALGIVIGVKLSKSRALRRPPLPSQPSELEPPNR